MLLLLTETPCRGVSAHMGWDGGGIQRSYRVFLERLQRSLFGPTGRHTRWRSVKRHHVQTPRDASHPRLMRPLLNTPQLTDTHMRAQMHRGHGHWQHMHKQTASPQMLQAARPCPCTRRCYCMHLHHVEGDARHTNTLMWLLFSQWRRIKWSGRKLEQQQIPVTCTLHLIRVGYLNLLTHLITPCTALLCRAAVCCLLLPYEVSQSCRLPIFMKTFRHTGNE